MPGQDEDGKYSRANAELAIALLTEGYSMTDAARRIGLTLNNFQKWRLRDPLFDKECARAISLGFEAQADSLLSITRQYPNVYEAKLMSDNIKWLLSKRAAGKYGDRLDINVTQTVDLTSAITDAKRRALPARYREDAEDAQLVEMQALPTPNATDSESVAAEKTEQNSIGPEIPPKDKSE